MQVVERLGYYIIYYAKAAIDVIVTLCRKSLGKRVCNVLRAVSAVTRRHFRDSTFVGRW